MKFINKSALAALLVAGGAIGIAAPANAEVGVSIGIGGPGYYGTYRDYDYYRPCSWYRYWDLPAPARCYGAYYGYFGPGVFLDGDFVFRDRDDWGRWRDRDDFRGWRERAEFHRGGDWGHRDWGHGDWGHGEGRGGWGRGEGHGDWGHGEGHGGWGHGDHGGHGEGHHEHH
jgi:hypothetical protein